MVNEYVERIKRMRNDYNNWCLNNNTGDNRDYWDEDTREDGNDWDENEEYDEMSDAHVSDCAATIASAYRNNGDYAHMWEALAEATNHNGDDHSELTHNIMWETITTSLCPPIKNASTSHLIEAAGRWRNEINTHAADGNALWESDARIAHALVCCELTRRNRITASDLAELIETMNSQRTFHDLTLNTPHGRQHVYDAATLIDAACPHMTR